MFANMHRRQTCEGHLQCHWFLRGYRHVIRTRNAVTTVFTNSFVLVILIFTWSFFSFCLFPSRFDGIVLPWVLKRSMFSWTALFDVSRYILLITWCDRSAGPVSFMCTLSSIYIYRNIYYPICAISHSSFPNSVIPQIPERFSFYISDFFFEIKKAPPASLHVIFTCTYVFHHINKSCEYRCDRSIFAIDPSSGDILCRFIMTFASYISSILPYLKKHSEQNGLRRSWHFSPASGSHLPPKLCRLTSSNV